MTPLVYAIVQPIAYHTAAAMGKDVDQPRSLAKSVTVDDESSLWLPKWFLRRELRI